MDDIADRLDKRVQMTSDGLVAYVEAVENSFEGQIDYAQVVKQYGTKPGDKRHQFIGSEKEVFYGKPVEKYISTNFVERQNLTMRMHMRRFTRKTNAFSKKIENHQYAVALHFVYYNFAKIHKTLRVTPAMEAGIADDIMEIADIIKLVDWSTAEVE